MSNSGMSTADRLTNSLSTEQGTRASSPPPRLSLTIIEAAGAIGISRRQIYVEMQSKRLGSIKVGKRRLIPADELRRWFRARPLG